MPVPGCFRVERVLFFALPRRLVGRGSPCCNSGARTLFFTLRRGTRWGSGAWTTDFSGSHNHRVRSVNSKPSLCNKYPTMLPALGQLAPTATPAPKARSPLRTTFRLGITGAFQTREEKAIVLYTIMVLFRVLFRAARLTWEGDLRKCRIRPLKNP
jgi:hypothetical protein